MDGERALGFAVFFLLGAVNVPCCIEQFMHVGLGRGILAATRGESRESRVEHDLASDARTIPTQGS